MTSLAYLDFYAGAYGNTIRIATKSKDWLILFREKLKDLLDGRINVCDICQIPHIQCFDTIGSLELTKVKKSSVPCVALKVVNGSNLFRWVQDEEEIKTILGMIDGLLSGDHPGHQYLVDEGDDFVIELSYNED
jgi:hypothetical protein